MINRGEFLEEGRLSSGSSCPRHGHIPPAFVRASGSRLNQLAVRAERKHRAGFRPDETRHLKAETRIARLDLSRDRPPAARNFYIPNEVQHPSRASSALQGHRPGFGCCGPPLEFVRTRVAE
jgi:hypothetical protein